MVMDASAHDGEVLTDRDRQRAETRRRVRQVALDVIRRDGLADARFDEIARLAGVSRGTVYFHYPTKEHVVAEVFAEAEARVAAALEELPRTAPVARVLEVFCAAYAREWEREAQLFPAVAVVALQRAAAAIKTKEYDAVHGVLAARFRVASDRGELTGAMHAGVVSNVFLTNVLAATLSWCGRSRPRLATVLGAVVEVFLNGARGSKK
jgi:AcrR family transcriptional regulator